MKITKGNLLGRVLVPCSVALTSEAVQDAISALRKHCRGATHAVVDGVWYNPDGDLSIEAVHLYEFACFDSNQMREGRRLLRELVQAMLEAGEQAVMYWEHDAQGVLVPVLVTKE